MISSPEHPLQNKNEILPEDLSKEMLIVREEGSSTRTLIEEFLDKHKIAFDKKVAIGDAEAIKRLVAARMGVAFVPASAITLEISAGILKVLSIVLGTNKLSIPMSFFVVTAKAQHYYPTVLAFLNFIRKWSPAEI